MATLLNSESRRLYSWWWDSHISPKNSKWLQENLTEMDAKVKAMIKLIEEDADSFARRAEMYYKKRPELMKLVEEFYRAYRALAERYDHLTVELRQAHRTMEEAFPNQVPFELDEESPSRSSGHDTETHTPDVPHQGRALLIPEKNRINFENSDSGISKRGLKQLREMIGAKDNAEENVEGRLGKAVNHGAEDQSLQAKVLQLSNENENLKLKALSESERAAKAESDIQNLKRALADVQAEKDTVFLQYQIYLERLTNLEAELMRAQNNSVRLNNQAITAEAEVQKMKEALTSLEVEKEAALIKQKESMEMINNLEGLVSHAKEHLEGVNKRLFKAENEALHLNNEISRLESEKDAGLQNYNHCLETICHLENKISLAEEDTKQFKQQVDLAETEVRRLREALTELNEEKESSAQQYKNCRKRISELENDISHAQEGVKRLDTEVLMGAMKLKNSEEKCNLLEISNQSLCLEAADLAKKIEIKDQELSKKQEELERLQISVQDEHLRYAQIEAMLQTLQNIHSQSEEEHMALALELKTGLKMLKDLEVCKNELEDEVQRVKDENHGLSELKMSSTISIENLQNEILCLGKMKERLEEEVAQQIGQSNSLQKEVLSLKEEMRGLNKRYQALLDKLESVGLEQDTIGPSIKNLQNENSRLRQFCEKESNEKGALSKKLEIMEELSEKKHALESSLSELNCELEASRGKVREMQETCQFVCGEKSILVAEKAALLSQVQILTDNMQKLLEKNAVLENSLLGAKVELQGLREKSKGLEEICQLLKNQKSDILTERGRLFVQLANVERRLEYLEKRFTGLEEKYADLEKENKSMHSEVLELRVSFGTEKHERTSSSLQSETRFINLEHHIDILQEESRWRKKEFEDEVDKAVRAQFEIFVLQKFIQDMEEKNYSLHIEFQKHVEASKLAEKLISELEGENLEQQVEAELLVDEIEKLRLGIYQVFRALGAGSDSVFEDKAESEQIFVHRIIRNIGDMKHSLLKSKDDELLLLVENSVLLTRLSHMEIEGIEIESKKELLEQDLNVVLQKLVMLQNNYDGLLEMNRQLKSEVGKGNQQIKLLEAEVECHSIKQGEMEKAYLDLQGKHSQVLDENRCQLEKISDLKEEKCLLEKENDVILQETLALASLSTVLESLGSEKLLTLNVLHKDMANLTGIKDGLEKDISKLKPKVEMKEAENFFLKDSIQRLEIEFLGVRESNDHLKQEILDVKDVLIQREAEILEVKQKFKAEENLNSKLCKTVDVLKAECHQSSYMRENMEKHLLKLSKDNSIRNKEIEGLREVNANLVSELNKLQEEYEVQRTREENLSSELRAKNNDFELWEAEASTFYFDLQISSIHGVLYENKVHELAEVCGSLEDETTTKSLVIEEMKGKLSFMENEIGELKAQLSAYVPLIASLRDDVASLEHKAILPTKLMVDDALAPTCTDVVVDYHENYHNKPTDEQLPMPTGIQDLRKLQSRIKAVEKAMVDEINKLVLQESLNTKRNKEAVEDEIEELKPQCSSGREKVEDKGKKVLRSNLNDNLKLQNDKPEAIDVRKGILMKDIPLDQVSDSPSYGSSRRGNGVKERVDDQMLELWETAEKNGLARIVRVSKKPIFAATERNLKSDQLENMKQKTGDSSTGCEVEKELSVDKLEVSVPLADPNQEVNNRKILERLASDARKLTGLQMAVQNLKRKLDSNKKSRKPKDVDLDTVKEQLQEVEETVVQLVDLNGQLVKNIEESPTSSEGKVSAELKRTSSFRRKKVSEQARKGFEKIGRLQLEVQKIEYVLLKLDDEKKSKGRSRFSRSRSTIILRDFLYNGRKNSGKKKKAHFCGCFKPSTNSDANHM